MKVKQKSDIVDAERADRLIYWFNHEPQNLPTWFSDAFDAGGIVVAKFVMAVDTPFGRLTAGAEHMILAEKDGTVLPIPLSIFQFVYEETL